MTAKYVARHSARKSWLPSKRHKRIFAFTTEAFFPARRWKFSKNLATIATAAAISFQSFTLGNPIALAADPELALEQYATTTAGVPLSLEETELLQQNLIIREHVDPAAGVTSKTAAAVVAELPEPAAVTESEPAAPLELSTVTSLGVRTLTAYNSEPGQTDDTPCITANGFNVCEHGIEDTVAANFLPFGTKIRIPELFGDRVFIVRDRMNKRYQSRIDVWMLEKSDAKQFGVRRAQVELVLE